MKRWIMTAAALAAFAGLAGGGPVQAQYPDKPIRLVIPFPAGGAVDLVARLVSTRFTADLGKPVVVENKPGAGGIISGDLVAKAPPDGYTLLLTTPNHTINGALKANMPYDTEKDFAPISVVAEIPELLVSHPSAPFKDFKGFVDYAKKNPDKLNYASAGNGTLPHVTTELMLQRLGVKVVHVPYRGAAPAMTDLLSGAVQLKMDTYATANQHIAAGRLHALAYASRKRSSLMPDVPTVAEMGVPGYEGILWLGILAPAKTPQAAIDRIAAASASAVKSPELLEAFKKQGVEPVGGTPAEFAALITREMVQWRDLAKTTKIVLE